MIDRPLRHLFHCEDELYAWAEDYASGFRLAAPR
jgi:hypothetical protein